MSDGTHDARRRARGRAALAPPLGAALALAALAYAMSGTGGGGSARAIRFVDATEVFGLARSSPTYDAAIGDYDGDGRDDIWVGNHGGPAVLLRRAGARFVDVAGDAGIDRRGDTHGAGWADYDNDGDLDLYVTLGADRGRATKRNRLYRNDGAGRFHDVGDAAGVADPRGRGRAVAWLDVDRDGWLDLVVANYATPCRLFRNRGDGTFTDDSEGSGLAAYSATRVAWGDVDADGDPDLLLSETPRGLRLLRNEGGARFADVTGDAGLARARGVQGMALGDYDGDGALDLYLSHGAAVPDVVRGAGADRITFAFLMADASLGFDFEAADGLEDALELQLYENGAPVEPERTRCGTALAAGPWPLRCRAADAVAGPAAVDTGFVLWRDPLAGAAGADPTRRRAWHLRWRGTGDHHLSGIVAGARRPAPVGLRATWSRGGSLWRGDGGGRFTRTAVVARGVNGMAAAWGDVDNDGFLDLYAVDSGADGAPGRNLLLRNNGKGGLMPIGTRGVSPVIESGRPVGAQLFDVDADGRLDLFLTNGWGVEPFDHGPYRLLRNASHAGAWIALALSGVRANRQGLGSWIRVRACGVTRVRYHTGGSNDFSQSAVPVHVGLGACRAPVDVVVEWPSGTVQRLAGVASGRLLTIDEAPAP